MLDFYCIYDEQPSPAYPEKLDLKLAGDLDYDTFSHLQNKGILSENLDYYTDFRWNLSTVRFILQKISNQKMEQDTDVKSLIVILDLAAKCQCGLIAYAD